MAKGLGELFEAVLVPTEEVVEIRRGRKFKSERRFFPGYVLVKMELTDQAYHLIKNTPKVTGFLGSDNKPIPITDAEAARILNQVQEGDRAAEDIDQFRDRRAGSRRRWSVRFLQRSRRGSGRTAGAAQSGGFHFRPADAGRTRIRAGRERSARIGGSRAR